MSAAPREGLVVYKSSRNIRVKAGGGVWLCSIRGRFRADKRGRLPVVVGDRVSFLPTSTDEGVLESILPRRNELRRARSLSGRESTPRSGERAAASEERIVAANMDQVLVVLACRIPPPRWGLVDRVLVSSQFEALEVGIDLNKWDQVEADSREAAQLGENLEVYRSLGYSVFRTTITRGEGKGELGRWLKAKSTVLSGHSGVGKSAILKAFCPGQDIQTGEVSRATGRGRHVTAAVTLYDLPEGGCLVDTPGYREYALHGLEAPDLSRHYEEFQPHISRCRFKSCLHVAEPDCAVLEALKRGEISELRYQNYLGLLEGLRGSI